MTYVDVIVRSCVAIASVAFSAADAFEVRGGGGGGGGDNEEGEASSLLMTAVFASFGLSVSGVILVICCFFFKEKRRRNQVAGPWSTVEGEDDSSETEKTVGGRQWHQVDGAWSGGCNAGDARFVGAHEMSTVSMKNEMLQQSLESVESRRDLRRSIGVKPSNGNTNLESTEEMRRSFHSSAEESEAGRLEAVTLVSENDTGPGFTIGKSSEGELFIKDVAFDGPAMKSKRVQQGDRISSLAISMENMALEHARTLLDLAKYYPIELHLMKTPYDVHNQMSDFEDSLEASFARLLQERSKSSSVNYLPTEDDDDQSKSVERPIYSCSQLPVSTEPCSRWRFENQPHFENHEIEAEVRPRSEAQMQWEDTADGDISEENRGVSLDEMADEEPDAEEGAIRTSGSVVEDHDRKFISPLNRSDIIDFDFPTLGGTIYSGSEWGRSLLADILPHLSEMKTEESIKMNSADSEENDFSNFTVSLELKEGEDSFEDERITDYRGSVDCLHENCLEHNSTVVSETENQCKKCQQNSVKQESLDFASDTQNDGNEVKINPYLGKHDAYVESVTHGAKSWSVMYGEDAADDDDDDDDYDDDDEEEEYDDDEEQEEEEEEEDEVTSSETNYVDLVEHENAQKIVIPKSNAGPMQSKGVGADTSGGDEEEAEKLHEEIATGKEGRRFISGGIAVTSSAGHDDDNEPQANDVTDDHTIGADVRSSNGHDLPTTSDVSETLFDWSQLTLEPLELPGDSSWVFGPAESNGREGVNVNVVDSKSCETDSGNANKFRGKEKRSEDRNNNVLVEALQHYGT